MNFPSGGPIPEFQNAVFILVVALVAVPMLLKVGNKKGQPLVEY
jgi:hypothetical protein